MALITLGINFTKNTSLQKGDTIYYLGTDSRVYKIGLVDIMGDDYIVCEITGDTLSQLTASSYIFFGKDNSKNVSGLLGYYMEVNLKNTKVDHAELFAVNTETLLSSK